MIMNTRQTKIHSILVLLMMLMFGSISGIAQTVSGSITDKSTGETLIGATILDEISGKGTVTNSHGRYSLTIKQDSVYLRISYIGYESQYFGLQLDDNVELNVQLSPAIELKAVTIRSERPTDPKSSQMSAIAIPVEQLKSVPVLFGEVDILKTLQLMPGVQSGSEGTSGMYVRGGGPDQNLFLLDGVPIYNVNHLGGFFSAFNGDAVKNVTLYKGSFPARFGGRLSSVLDITTNNGNDKEYHGLVNIGLISAKLCLEGPIVKEKTTFSVSARRTYGDALLQPVLWMIQSMNEGDGMESKIFGGYYFYDLNAKITHKFSEKSRLYASYYMGDDVVYAKIKYEENGLFNGFQNVYSESLNMGMNWGNIVASLRWNYVINPKLFMNLTGSFTRYRNDIAMGYEFFDEWYDESRGNFVKEEDMMEMNYKSGIKDFATRVDFDYTPTSEHNIKFGGSFTHHIFTPEVIGFKVESNYADYLDQPFGYDTTISQSLLHANELNAFIEDDWSITEALKMNLGLALSGFGVEDAFYPSIQPRLSGRWLLNDNLSAKFGYAYMTQYMHLLSTTGVSLPTDLWVPVTANIEPMNAHQVAAGLSYNLLGLLDLSLEGYYKSMDNLMEYKDGATFFGTSVDWEDKVCLGRGWAYGVEFLAQKTVGDFTGWLAYTWSKTMRLFDKPGQVLNNGDPFPAKYDRRHDFSIVLMYKPNDKFDISATWVYCTGNAATLAMHEYEIVNGPNYSNILPHVSSRNNFRMPDYHRLDIGMSFHKQKKHGVRTWNISVYNAYNHQNPYMIYEGSQYNSTIRDYERTLMQLSIFPIIPSVSYQYRF